MKIINLTSSALLAAVALAPVTASAGGVYNGLAYTDCAAGGPTAADATLAALLSPLIHTPRTSGLDAGQLSCARVILQTALDRGLSSRAGLIAITTAMAETALHDFTDTASTEGTSKGLYQQISGWGSEANRENAEWSTNAFLNAMIGDYPSNLWESGDIGAICQQVQESDVPSAYDPEVAGAQIIVTALIVTPPPPVMTEANLAPNGDFNASAVGWNHSGTTNMVRYASGTGGATAYEGGGYLATNTSSAGGNIATDITRTIVAGETYCVSGQFTSLGSSGGSGGLALWLLGGTTESASKGVGSLSVGTWTPAQTCVTATSAHSTIRVQFYPTVHGQTVGLDAINLNHNLATNGDFNASSDGWSATGAGTHMVRYASGSGGSTAYEGAGWLATNAATGGGSVVLDRTITVHAGDTYCVSAQLTTAGLGTSGGGSLAIWFMGGSGNEGSNKTVSGLDGSSVWTPATTCTTATGEHTTVRVQFYPTVGGPTVGIDAVNLTRNLVPNAGFNDSTSGWAHGGATTNMVRYSSGTSGTTAYEGSSYLATNTTTAGGSVFTDIPVVIHAGDSYCVTAHLTTLGAGSGGGGLALWFMGGSNEGSSKGVSALPGKSIWTPVTTCSTATTDHTTLRVQFYPTVGGATVGIDAVSID